LGQFNIWVEGGDGISLLYHRDFPKEHHLFHQGTEKDNLLRLVARVKGMSKRWVKGVKVEKIFAVYIFISSSSSSSSKLVKKMPLSPPWAIIAQYWKK